MDGFSFLIVPLAAPRRRLLLDQSLVRQEEQGFAVRRLPEL
jgi:hypothetical protein